MFSEYDEFGEFVDDEMYDDCDGLEEFADCYTSDEFETAKEEFIKSEVRTYGADKRIIEFIAELLYHSDEETSFERSISVISSLFDRRFNYYFVKMLEIRFPGGVVCYNVDCWAFAYVYEELAYDSQGVSHCTPEQFVPEDQLGDLLDYYKEASEDWATGSVRDRLDEFRAKAIAADNFVFTLSAESKEAFEMGRAFISDSIPVDLVTEVILFESKQIDYQKKVSSGEITEEEFEKEMTDFCIKLGTSWQLVKRLKSRI